MNADASSGSDQAERVNEERHEVHSYVWGICLAIVLTLVPFGLVRFGGASRATVLIVIGVLAFVQVVVHFRFFLHIGFHQQREDLQLILFSAVILLLLVGGTIWIMGSLASRMALP